MHFFHTTLHGIPRISRTIASHSLLLPKNFRNLVTRDRSTSMLHGTGRVRFLFFAILFLAFPVYTTESFLISESTLTTAEKKYGSEARGRLLAWQQLVNTEKESDELKKIRQVNLFFNTVPFLADAVHWGKSDYWATPIELLASAGGDCEDFAIAKYFTLRMLGVADKKITLTYVRALKLDQAHMVLTYYPSPGAEPLILDNLFDTVESASKRPDLLPVYSFNGSGLWLAKQRGQGKMVGSSNRLQRWQDLLSRLPGEINLKENSP